MPYSITTKDGITIKNIPDDIDPNSDILKQRVAKIRAENNLSVQPQEQSVTDKLLNSLQDAPTNQLGLVETGLSLASSLPASAAGGVAGIAQSLNPFAEAGAGAKAVKDVTEALTFQPKTQAGKEIQQKLGRGLESLNKNIINPAVAGGLATSPLLSKETNLELAKDIKSDGVGRALGNQVLDVTDFPAAAAVTEALPVAIESFFPARLLRAPSKAKIKFIGDEIKKGNLKAAGVAKELNDKGQLITNKNIKKAIKVLGNDEAANSFVINSRLMNEATKKQTNKMLDSIEAIKKSGDPVKAIKERPVNVIGESLAARALKLNDIKKQANRQLDEAINTDLKNKTINISAPARKFISDLEKSGVAVIKDETGRFKVDTSNAVVDLGDVLSEKKLENIINQIAKGEINAEKAHKLKKFVRTSVNFDPAKVGAVKPSIEVESAIKNLSSAINDKLGSASSKYARANKKFSTVIDSLSKADKMLGKNLLIGDELAASKLGSLSKRIGSNLASREQITDLVKSLDDALIKNKIRPKDDIERQVAALADLERIFKLEGDQAPFSFQSRVAKGAIDAKAGIGASDVLEKGLNKILSMSNPDFDKKIKAIRKLTQTKSK